VTVAEASVFGQLLEEFSRERLDGRPVPEDLRILAQAQWEGHGHPFEQFGVTILEPGAQDPLTDHSYLSEEDRANPDIVANCAAFEQIATFLKAVAEPEQDVCYGYWLHPRQREDQPPPVVKVDSEGTFETLGGRTFSEACLWDLAFGDDELFAEVAAELAQLHISVTGGSAEDLPVLSAAPAPEDVHVELYYAELERLGLPGRSTA
jgi:hypothetical protein